MAIEIRDIDLEEIYDFVENGVPSEQTSDVMKYMLEMEKVRGMMLRIDKWASKDAVVAHLMKIDGYSRHQAVKMYNQSLEYFYCDTTVSKAAWRNIYAEKMEKVINFAIAVMENTTDASKVGRMILDMAKIRQLDQPDVQDFPDGLFDKPFKVYTLNPEDVGVAKEDRRSVSEFIDGLPELTDLQRETIKREAGLLPTKIFLDKNEDPRNND